VHEIRTLRISSIAVMITCPENRFKIGNHNCN